MKTLDNTHLYCEPPEVQPQSVEDGSELPSLKVGTSPPSQPFSLKPGADLLLSPLQVFMGNLQVDLGLVQYDSDSLLSPVPLAAQVGLAAGAAVIILSVLVVILMYRYGGRPLGTSVLPVLVSWTRWCLLSGGRANRP